MKGINWEQGLFRVYMLIDILVLIFGLFLYTEAEKERMDDARRHDQNADNLSDRKWYLDHAENLSASVILSGFWGEEFTDKAKSHFSPEFRDWSRARVGCSARSPSHASIFVCQS